MGVLQPMWLRKEDVPVLPDGWTAMPTSEATVQLHPGKLYDSKTVDDSGAVPVLSQSESGFVGFHNEDPGVVASRDIPVVTFANHTCAMRLMRHPFSCIQNIFPKVGKEGVCDTIYFYYAAQGRVSLADYKGHHPLFRQAHIPIPPLPTQRKIAAILSAYDDLIENNRRRIQVLEEMAQALYREWFVEFRFPGHENVRMVDSPLGQIPEAWEATTLGEVCHITMGFSPKSEFYNDNGDGLPFHQGVTNYGELFPTHVRYCTKMERLAEAGDILFSVRAPVGRINVSDRRIIIGRGLASIRSKTDSQTFCLYQLRDRFQEEDIIGGGTIFKAVTKQDMHGVSFLWPPEHLRRTFEETAHPIFEQVANLTRRKTSLRRTRDLLLPRLISGELDVSDLDIDVVEESA